MEYFKRATELKEDTILNRRHIHKNAEVGLDLPKTKSFVAEKLKEYGLEPEECGHGITAMVGKKGKVFLLRADMDALPMGEESGLEFACNTGTEAHTCGHDIHTSMLLTAAKMLKENEDNLEGTVKFMFQPAEEIFKGAKDMIKAGILENPKVDAAFGLHVWGPYPEGKALTIKGPMMAAPDNIRIKLIGKGGHASMPNTLIDPVVMAAEVILSLQTIVSRKIDPLESAVISCCSIHGGSAQNVIPNEVEITGTVRTLNEDVRKKMPELMEQTIKGIADIYNGSYEFDYHFGYPCLINDPKSTDILISAAGKILGDENVNIMPKPVMGGEDFAFFSQEVPSAFIFLGVAEDMENPPVHHHPKFSFHSRNTVTSSEILTQAALDFLENSK